jgi:GTP-binding protein
VDTIFSYGGKEYLLIDTAGIRRRGKVKEKIEKISMIKAIKSLNRCDVAVILIDALEGIAEQDARISGYALDRGRGVVLGINKWDLVKKDTRKRGLLDDAIDRQLKLLSFAPRVNISALTGERVMRLFEKIDLVYSHFSTRIATPNLNRFLQKVVEKHLPPRSGRGRLKFFYATQAGIKPPTFVLFVNKPDLVHFSYERFLINQIRENFGLAFTPIKLIFKKK